MDSELASYNIFNLHTHDATLDEESSYFYLSQYRLTKTFNYSYESPPYALDDLHILISNFALFYAKIKDNRTGLNFPINKPLYIFRYIMLEDGSWSPFYTLRKKHGYVVEGMSWSNGMFYQVREDKQNEFEIYHTYLSIDHITKTMYQFPDMESNDNSE